MFFSKAIYFFVTFFAVASMISVVVAEIQTSGTGRATFFTPSVGACGHTNTEDDFIVAIASNVFQKALGGEKNPNNNPICNKKLTAKFKGKSVSVTIVDECPGCGTDGLDLSPAAFKKLADLSVGVLEGTTWTIS
ncbi:hypothetical protein K474DRAFT_1669265 [Panus rudis PR-1116 ss-1]|nr:hypothetical protein K474DRAFT_1669265 [Panus rudis PR-1116 ss-1]